MKPEILLVDDDPAIIRFMGKLLAGVGHQRFATDGEAALRTAREAPPDLMLLDAEMPRMTGFEVCTAMKADPLLRHVPVIFVTSHTDPEVQASCLHLGADDYVAKPFDDAVLVHRVKAHLRNKFEIDELRRVATVDTLTGLANDRDFLRSLRREWRRGQRAGTPMSLLRVDLDHYGAFVDHHGTRAGDRCLLAVADALRASVVRPGDLVARCGIDRFGLLLPQTPRRGAQHVAHRLLDAVEALAIGHATSPIAGHVTASVGVSSYDECSAGWTERGAPMRPDLDTRISDLELLHAAEEALLCAKAAGGAQAWQLDIGHAKTPMLAREVDPTCR